MVIKADVVLCLRSNWFVNEGEVFLKFLALREETIYVLLEEELLDLTT